MRGFHAPFSFRSYLEPARLFWRRWICPKRVLAGREALQRLGRRRIVLRLEGLEERLVPAAPEPSLGGQLGNTLSGLVAAEVSAVQQFVAAEVQILSQVEQGLFAAANSLLAPWVSATTTFVHNLEATFFPSSSPGNGFVPPPPLPTPPSAPQPMATDDSYSLIHDGALSVSAANGVLANDTDPSNLPLTAVLLDGPRNGILSLHSDGSFSYIPNAGFVGNDSFIYNAYNGSSHSNTATVTLTVDSTISGQVWLDSNQDGIENNGETGMSGVTVNLIDANGQSVSSTTTDANGNYQLSVDPSLGNQVQIQAVIPQGDSATIPFASSSGIVSSINDSGYSNHLTLPSRGGLNNVNVGLAPGAGPLASLSGQVWLDSDDDGVLNNNETGLQAVNVNLLDSTGKLVTSTSTDANGNYSFQGLTPNTPYMVQFIAPNSGYVFVPQDVGSPNTSSSAGANGNTAPITFTPGQDLTTVNAGLFGSAPIVYQTSLSLLAENDSYTGMDFAAAGYDPNGQTLTPIIVQMPTHGSLVFNPSTGLYDYSAPSNYTGLDNFQFELSNGHTVSDVVSVQILAYHGTIQPGTFDNFPDLAAALFTGGTPIQGSIQQGALNDCWFVAAAAGVAQQDPNQIVSLITTNANNTYSVTLPSYNAVDVSFTGDTNNYSTANGDWLKVLEKGYAETNWISAGRPAGRTPYSYIDSPNTPGAGITALTGRDTRTDAFDLTALNTTRQRLTNALTNGKVVTALIAYGNNRAGSGLVTGHIYTVVAYNSQTNQVKLRNPWGSNPTFNKNGDANFFLGKNDSDNPSKANNGYFWMSLSDFTSKFDDICYEQ